MTALIVPDLNPNWPATDADLVPTQEAVILHELVIELGIPEIVLVERVCLVGTDIPGDITFGGDGWEWDGWSDLYADALGPQLDGERPDDVARTPSGDRACAGRARRTRKTGASPGRCKRAARDGSAYCEQHGGDSLAVEASLKAGDIVTADQLDEIPNAAEVVARANARIRKDN